MKVALDLKVVEEVFVRYGYWAVRITMGLKYKNYLGNEVRRRYKFEPRGEIGTCSMSLKHSLGKVSWLSYHHVRRSHPSPASSHVYMDEISIEGTSAEFPLEISSHSLYFTRAVP